jgi:signal transduction histidine kinase
MNAAARSTRRVSLRDTGLAVLLTAASAALLRQWIADAGRKLPNAIGPQASLREHLLVWSLAAAGCATGLIIRRHAPAAALVLGSCGAAVHYADARLPHLPLDLAAPVTLYTVAAMAGTRRTSRVALAGALAAATAAVAFSQSGLIVKGSMFPPATVAARLATAALVPVLVLVISWVTGDATRTRRAYLGALQQRAAALERERDQRDALAAAAERARLTREMHDVVAHGLSVMVAQAQGGAAALRRHPERTQAALDEVIATGRQSLAEMRQLLGAARGGTGTPALSPQPGLAALADLVDQVRRAGTQVQLTVDGEPTALPATLDASAYRIVQEALTNTRKHAGEGARASIRVAFRDHWMEIEASDSGPGTAHGNGHGAGGPPDACPAHACPADACPADACPADGTAGDTAGNGLRGIRERVELLGGQVTAAPRAEGGFRVHAILPVRAQP